MVSRGMPVREAYRKAGVDPAELDWDALEMDIKSCAKELAVKPRKGLWSNQPKTVGPKDLLRAMGYTEYGYPIKMQKWDPGAREGCHPRSCLRTPLPAPRPSLLTCALDTAQVGACRWF